MQTLQARDVCLWEASYGPLASSSSRLRVRARSAQAEENVARPKAVLPVVVSVARTTTFLDREYWLPILKDLMHCSYLRIVPRRFCGPPKGGAASGSICLQFIGIAISDLCASAILCC